MGSNTRPTSVSVKGIIPIHFREAACIIIEPLTCQGVWSEGSGGGFPSKLRAVRKGEGG